MKSLLPWSKLFLVALAFSYFGSLLYSASQYPEAYDWRHTVMSSLASPDENPAAFQVAAYGMAVSGVLLSLLAFGVRSSLQPHAPKWTAFAQWVVVTGGILLTVSALLTPGYHTYFGLPKAHAKIAQAAGFCFSLGMALNVPAIICLPARQSWARHIALFLVTVPVSLYLVCRIVIPALGVFASPSDQQAIRESIQRNLAFWEWVGSVSVYLFMTLVIWSHKGTQQR